MRALLLALLLLAPVAFAADEESDSHRAERARSTFPTDGGLAAYVVEALAAMGIDPRSWPSAEGNVFDAMAPDLRDDDPAYKASLRITYAIGVSGLDARDFHGTDLVAHVRSGFDGAQFGEPATINDDIWAILALRAAGVPASEETISRTVAALSAAQGADGGWGWAIVPSDTDTSAMAIAALASAGVDVSKNTRAAAYFDSVRHENGGYKNGARGTVAVNTQSTVWALHARQAMGLPEDVESLRYLRERQLEDGAFQRSKDLPKPNSMATIEAALYLAGGRHPLPGWADPAIEVTPARAGEPSRLRVGSAFSSATWTLDGVSREGVAIEHAFSRWGDHAFSVHAVGDRVHARASGVVAVPTFRPVARVAEDSLLADRHELVRPDLSASTDADGEVVEARVDWGDGTAEVAPLGAVGHAYDLPGNYKISLRVRDDAGAWSDLVSVQVEVRDRAPRILAPERLVADRVATLAVPVAVSDPDGDPWTLAWTLGDVTGEGPPELRFSTLGARTLRLVATDTYGMSAEATTLIEVVDLAPEILSAEARVAADGMVDLVAEAADADGPSPSLSWSVDGARVEGTRIRLAPGAHAAVVVATDAEGMSASRQVAFVVGAPTPVARVDLLEVRVEAGWIVVDHATSPPDALVRVEWEGDGAQGEAAPLGSPFRIPMGTATEVRVRLTTTLGETTAIAERTATRPGEVATAPPILLEASTARAGEAALLRAAAAGAVEYRFDLGDGNTTPWASEPSVEHAYERPGVYALVAQARSASGAVSNASGTIVIEAARLPDPPRSAPVATPPSPTATVTTSVPTPLAQDRSEESTEEPAPPQEAKVPLPPLVLAVAFALALALRRRPRAPGSRPTRRSRR